MYSNLKNVQLLVSMLKEKGVKNIVVSPGNSHNAIVRSIEEDNFFKTYNIVDERSAAFFACGVIQQLNEPVAIMCTSGTAAINYLTGVIEAARRNLPLIVITADKNPYYLNQQEDQMVEQITPFRTVVKHSVSLPIVKDGKDEWYCTRLLNEVFLEMKHHGIGPVQINVPIEDGMLAIGKFFTEAELPKINVIERFDCKSTEEKIKNKFEQLKGKKILIICGQDNNISENRKRTIEGIFENYNCIFAIEKLSNLHCNGTIDTARVTMKLKYNGTFKDIVPDVVITIGGNVAWDGKFSLKENKNNFEHWIVTEEGKVQDYYKNLTTIFEMDTDEFLNIMVKYEIDNSKSYYDIWKQLDNEIQIPEFEYSNLYVTQKLMNNLPKESILNLGNSSTIRIAQYFNMDNTIEVYCNRGANGIDGCMSTFIGQSAVTDKLSFLIIGDLTFFYDMNALWNRYVGKNVRIMLVNNGGASLFHFNQGLQKFPTLNENVAAEHFATAKGWVESQNIKYISAKNKEEFDNNLNEFLLNESDRPIVFEVFTDKAKDAELQKQFYEQNMDTKAKIKKEIKTMIKGAIWRM